VPGLDAGAHAEADVNPKAPAGAGAGAFPAAGAGVDPPNGNPPEQAVMLHCRSLHQELELLWTAPKSQNQSRQHLQALGLPKELSNC
jgi:hypothetical protein